MDEQVIWVKFMAGADFFDFNTPFRPDLGPKFLLSN
jgi:hypothetical protein